MSIISLKIEFGGGLELLFSNQRIYKVTLPSRVPLNNRTDIDATEKPNLMSSNTETKPADITYLIHYMRDHLLKEREELFMESATVRPGILVLINDTDWELEGEGDYMLKDGDEIVFISTLHGG